MTQWHPCHWLYQRSRATESQRCFQKPYLKLSARSTPPWLLKMQICFLLKVEHIPVKPSRHLQGLVSITTSRTVSLCAVTVATSESTRWVFCVQISAPYLSRCFLCLLEPIPSPYIVYCCPDQLLVGSLQPLKAGSANPEMRRDFICPSLRTESVWRTIWALSQGAEGQLACECRIIWVPADKEYKLKHHIKTPEIPLAAISLGNSFAVEETIAPSWSSGWFVTVCSPDNFPTGCFAPKQDRAEIISLEVGKEGKKESYWGHRCFFYPHQGLQAWKVWRPVLWCFTGGFLHLPPRWNSYSAPSWKMLEFGISE